MQQTSEIYKELLEAQQLGDPSVKFQTRLTIGEPGVLITKQGDSITFGSKAYTKTASGSTIVLTETEDRPLKGLRVFGKTTQNGIPTPDAPVSLNSVGADGSVAVTVCGKNLLKNTGVTTTSNGVTFTVNDDGSVTANGTASASASKFTITLSEPLPAADYIMTGCPIGGTANTYLLTAFDGTYYYEDIGNGRRLTNISVKEVNIWVRPGVTVNNLTFYPMIRLASNTDSTYEPYKGGSVSISLHNGLPGIPVSSGGNYTDGSGQQWICDEVDFEKGVYVQRVEREEGITEFVGNPYANATGTFMGAIKSGLPSSGGNDPCIAMCDRLSQTTGNAQYQGAISSVATYGGKVYISVENTTSAEAIREWLKNHPLSIQYILAKENTIPLSTEQLAAFALLHTNAPNTTVFNDSGAYTEIKYTMNGDGPSRILTGVSGADSGYDETVLISMETDARVFSEDTPEVGASISSQIDIEMIKPFAELPKQARLVPYVRLSDGLRHSEWIQKGVFYIDTRSKIEDGSSIEKIVLHGYDDMLKAEQDYPESTLSWPAKDLDVVREIAEFIGVAVDDRTVSIMNRGYTIQYPTGYSCRDVLGYIAAMYAGSFIMSDLGDLRLVTIYGIPKETRYLIEPNGYVITFGGDRILV